jgi:CRP-like cAMP-binding protein
MAGPLNLEQIILFLLETPMFGDLDAAELSRIVHIMQVQRLREGQLLFEEGQPGDAWYVLYEGSVEVVKDDGAGESVIAVFGPRTCFGEMAILDGSPRSATVQAAASSTVLRFPREDFLKLIGEDNIAAYKLVYQMAKVLAKRQRSTTARLVQVIRKADDEEAVGEELAPIVKQSTTAE